MPLLLQRYVSFCTTTKPLQSSIRTACLCGFSCETKTKWDTLVKYCSPVLLGVKKSKGPLHFSSMFLCAYLYPHWHRVGLENWSVHNSGAGRRPLGGWLLCESPWRKRAEGWSPPQESSYGAPHQPPAINIAHCQREAQRKEVTAGNRVNMNNLQSLLRVSAAQCMFCPAARNRKRLLEVQTFMELKCKVEVDTWIMELIFIFSCKVQYNEEAFWL